eukprot:Gregarina_sp_Pseudo_9__2517@NODE_2793_length_872_cov_1491_061224_g2556_i0_p1_GENE_NODE_2793_length_872_cov_1491_061224_g2556_i0NODE_2793_length_872_cov_1491_061224_g2556_i0_p1_ORF_typecomplete_len247_score47_95Reticulon/PF02453_17/5_2e11Reticulon/PF02453_17/0_00066DUF2534/PF10749_9/0_27Hum_adeno_E3A/PF05393_11/0_41DUF4133/PF13571_6/3_9e03DUF4133/PF13571_6/3_2DUF4133/PF13571_6/1_9e02Ndc1_Nup/PF09531_10/2_3_NODE_2793_length_872_cov_1491_061224_g2556_i082741
MSSVSTSAGTTPDGTRTAAGSSAMVSFGASLKHQYAHAASWENITFSASVLCGVNLIFILMWSLNLPALALVFYCLAVTVVLSFPLTHFFLKASADDKQKEVIQEKQFMDWARDLYASVNSFASFTRGTLYWNDKRRSVVVVGGLFGSGWICSYLSLSSMVWLALNVALVWMPAQRLYNKHLSKSVEPYMHKISAQLEKVVSRIPMLTDRIVDSKTKKI